MSHRRDRHLDTGQRTDPTRPGSRRIDHEGSSNLTAGRRHARDLAIVHKDAGHGCFADDQRPELRDRRHVGIEQGARLLDVDVAGYEVGGPDIASGEVRRDATHTLRV